MAKHKVEKIESFERHPKSYKHWNLSVDGPIASLELDVAEDGGIFAGYSLKLNSYDLGVDLELADAVQRIRFEHPEVSCVVISASKDKIFCAGANIFMLGATSHPFKVNFCKFTNETRCTLEEASRESGIRFLCASNGTASGGGYELALACDEIGLIDDGNSAVSLPEVPLLGVLPGTGGLTRVTDKRKVRRDLADFFSSVAEGVRGQRAVDWGLVDWIAPKSTFENTIKERANILAKNDTHISGDPVVLPPIEVALDGIHRDYQYVRLSIDPIQRSAKLTVRAPLEAPPTAGPSLRKQGANAWVLRAFRELDDAILHLRMNHLEIALVELHTEGRAEFVLEAEKGMLKGVEQGDRFALECFLHMRRVLKRLDMTSKTFLGLVTPSSCFVGCLAELLFLSDRSYILDDLEGEENSSIQLSAFNDGKAPMANGLTRLETRFYGNAKALETCLELCQTSKILEPEEAERAGLVTFCRDDIDFPDEVRLFVEERIAMSPDALTGMEANLRWPGPETMETRIFGRLTAWQNWIFTRANATGPEGALTNYGKPTNPAFDPRRC